MSHADAPGPPPRRGLLRWLTQDWGVNRGRRESQLLLVWFRAAQWALVHGGRGGRAFADGYRLLTSCFVSLELPPQVRIGPRLRLLHPHAVVLHPAVVIGADCLLRQSVTIGNVVRRGEESGVPVLGAGVELGAGCVVIGGIRVGDGAKVGALALVLDDVPAHGVAVGNPAQLVKRDPATG